MPLLTRPSVARPSFHPLTVAEVRPAAEHAVALALAVPDDLAEEFLTYRPGQYLTLRADIGGEQVRQSYSLWTPPQRAREERRLRVATARVEGGRMSPWLTEAVAPGASIDVLRPLGDFVLEPADRPRRHVCIVGGSGLTPVLAITAAALAEHPGSRVDLVLANRTRSSTVLGAELADLTGASGGRLAVTHVLSRENAPGARHGRVTPEVLDAVLGADPRAVDHWWLCGPEGLIELAEQWLAEQGVPPERTRRERFTSTGPVDPPRSPRGPGQRS